MSLATQVAALATAIGNYLRDTIGPRLLPAGGNPGQVLTRTSPADYATSWATPSAGGGGAVLKQTVLTVPSVGYYAEVVVLDPDATGSAKVSAQWAGELDAENDIEELADSGLRVFAVPEAGQIRFVLTGIARFVGDFKVNYQLNL